MTLEEQSRLSCYRPLMALHEAHNVYLVRHIESGVIYVKKTLVNFQPEIFDALKADPIEDMPRICETIRDGEHLIVIETYLPGRNLQQILDGEGPLPLLTVCRIGRQLCRILGQLHARGIIHRDIKPSNIILTEEGNVKLLDLDAAKVYQPEEKKDTHLLGTRGYAAPEQYGFGASSPLTDIYAVGMLLNVLATGEFPDEIQTEDPALRAVIRGCIQLDPAGRYESVRALDAALEAVEKRLRRGQEAPAGARKKILWIAGAAACLLLLGLIASRVMHGRQESRTPSAFGTAFTADAGSDKTPDTSQKWAESSSSPASSTTSWAEPLPSQSELGQIETVPEETTAPVPRITSSLREENTGEAVAMAGQIITIMDTVSYEGLEAGREYILKGQLWDIQKGEPLLTGVSGSYIDPVYGETFFTAQTPSGTVEVRYHLNLIGLAGIRIGVREELWSGTERVTEGAISAEEGSIVYVPRVTTGDPQKNTAPVLREDGRTVLTETVNYSDLLPGRDYLVQGVLLSKGTGLALTVYGQSVVAETRFTADATEGAVELTFNFNGSGLSGTDFYVRVTLMLGDYIIGHYEDSTGESGLYTVP